MRLLLLLFWLLSPYHVASFALNSAHRLLTSRKASEDPDLFDYFDPLLSPHAYPGGISPDSQPQDLEVVEESPSVSQPAAPRRKFGFSVDDQTEESTDDAPNLIDPSTFDPTLSPHAYASAQVTTIGVLLIDHGSKRETSNQRLEALAQAYQETVPSNIIVQAAHMEIATPSIADGLASLLEQNVDEIVCHPYFLSPGRHVLEDIPELVAAAKTDLQIDIPVTVTEPLGSQTNIMVDAIHQLVQKSVSVRIDRE